MFLTIVVAVVVAVVVGVLVKPGRSSTVRAAPEVGHPAPIFSLRNLDGKLVSPADYRGKVVLINFFATWCVPCRLELPGIDRIARGHARTFRVLVVDKQEPASDVRSFIASAHLGVVPLLDPNLSVWDQYGVKLLQPVSFWLDKKGVIRAKEFQMTPAVVANRLQALGG